MKTKLYTCFHLNLFFSSLEIEDRATVIDRCYWPLLRLAEKRVPIGLEAPSATLQEIERLRPDWISKAKVLLREKKLDFVFSGHHQIIAPLSPPVITKANLRVGLTTVQRLLGIRPTLALVNEQAFSNGLISLYREIGFTALMMDWADPASHQPDIARATLDAPQVISDDKGNKISVLWSDAISFQKFQRFVHREYFTEEYLDFVDRQLERKPKAFPLYTSDAEVIEYRPGRFDAEAPPSLGEYKRLEVLFEKLSRREDASLALPSDALKTISPSSKTLTLGCANHPIPVKKQRKYNITRWGLTGRADVRLNTHAWRALDQMPALPEAIETAEPALVDQWRDHLELWASDYRTHITEKRWQRLMTALPKVKAAPELLNNASSDKDSQSKSSIEHWQNGRFDHFYDNNCHLVINRYRGMAIRAFGYGSSKALSSTNLMEGSLIGTLPHGYYQDIQFGADFYSGHMVIEPGDSHKVADLQRLDDLEFEEVAGSTISLSATIQTRLGALTKSIIFNPAERWIEITHQPEFTIPLGASARLGHLTLNPAAFDLSSLWYGCHNGGTAPDIFSLKEAITSGSIDQGRAVSRLVSASSGLGMTEGRLAIGDRSRGVELSMDRRDCAGLGLLHVAPVGDTAFIRAMISVGEADETSKPCGPAPHLAEPLYRVRYRLLDDGAIADWHSS